MVDIRFMLVGYFEGKGYAVKDLQDEVVEYLSKDKLLRFAKVVKIYGVENGDINLDWFKTYYSKYAMIYGEEDARYFFSLSVDDCGRLEFCRNIGSLFVAVVEPDYDFRFIEFVEKCDFSDVRLLKVLGNYLCAKRSSLFHLENKFKQVGVFNISCVNGLDINNILEEEAVVGFSSFMGFSASVSVAYIDKLSMKNITYSLRNHGGFALINTPRESTVWLNFDKYGQIFIRNGCNLDNVYVLYGGKCDLDIFLEDGICREDVQHIFAKLPHDEYMNISNDVGYGKCNFKKVGSSYRIVRDKRGKK